MNLSKAKKSDFLNVPNRKWDEEIGEFDSLVLIPTRKKHDSGYMCMEFVAIKDNEPLCKLGGCSDVLNLDGIGGYGRWDIDTGLPKTVPPKGWTIDCLPCGYLRLFCEGKITASHDLSSLEIYGDRRAR